MLCFNPIPRYHEIIQRIMVKFFSVFYCILRSCWEWENKMRSIIALVIFILGCYYFEPYMFPGVALLILLKYYLVCKQTNLILLHFTLSKHFSKSLITISMNYRHLYTYLMYLLIRWTWLLALITCKNLTFYRILLKFLFSNIICNI